MLIVMYIIYLWSHGYDCLKRDRVLKHMNQKKENYLVKNVVHRYDQKCKGRKWNGQSLGDFGEYTLHSL